MTISPAMPERAASIFGVPARFYAAHVWPHGLTFSTQTARTERRAIPGRKGEYVRAELRFDDNCKNGRNSFAITGTIYDTQNGRIIESGGGCVHDEIVAAFPELEHMVKWHLTDTNGPLHYIANTIYLAGDKDCRGLTKGEARQLVNGRTKEPCWQLVTRDHLGEIVKGRMTMDAHDKPSTTFTTQWEPWNIEGEGKERDLDAARRAAVWPDATDAELTQDKHALTAALKARLPGLLTAFRADIEAAGFTWSVPNV